MSHRPVRSCTGDPGEEYGGGCERASWYNTVKAPVRACGEGKNGDAVGSPEGHSASFCLRRSPLRVMMQDRASAPEGEKTRPCTDRRRESFCGECRKNSTHILKFESTGMFNRKRVTVHRQSVVSSQRQRVRGIPSFSEYSSYVLL